MDENWKRKNHEWPNRTERNIIIQQRLSNAKNEANKPIKIGGTTNKNELPIHNTNENGQNGDASNNVVNILFFVDVRVWCCCYSSVYLFLLVF